LSVANDTATANESATGNPYECMFLVDSGRYAGDPEGTVGEILGMVEKAGGTVVAHRAWQEGRLAYEIEGQRKGLHYLVLFHMPSEDVKVLDRSVSLNDLVLRHMVIRQTPVLFEAMLASLDPSAHAGEEGESESGDEV
jgi:small subunit ribosomal protein S6